MGKMQDTPFHGMTPEQWLNKADYEGSIEEAFQHGLSAAEIDPTTYPTFHALVAEAHNLWVAFNNAATQLETYTE